MAQKKASRGLWLHCGGPPSIASNKGGLVHWDITKVHHDIVISEPWPATPSTPCRMHLPGRQTKLVKKFRHNPKEGKKVSPPLKEGLIYILVDCRG